MELFGKIFTYALELTAEKRETPPTTSGAR